MKRQISILLVIGALLATALAAFAIPTRATSSSGSFVLEGGINRTEGFVPFVSGATVQTNTANPYDIVSTVYRVDSALAGVRVEISGGQSTWQPWVASGIGTPVFEGDLWVFPMAFPASGKIEVGLRVLTPSVVNHISVSAMDGAGDTEVRQADVSPVGQPPTATPTATPSPTITPEPLIVLEGGINSQEGFTPFDPAQTITITTAFPVDIIATVYNRGEAIGARVTISGYRSWTATVAGGTGSLEFVGDSEWGLWAFEGTFLGTGPIELVVRTTTPSYRPGQWNTDVSAVPLGTGDWQVRHAVVQNSKWGVFLPIMFK